MPGVTRNLQLAGNKVLFDATQEVLGECKPYSLTGSLPLVKELQDEGFDIQIIGYGLMKTYHVESFVDLRVTHSSRRPRTSMACSRTSVKGSRSW